MPPSPNISILVLRAPLILDGNDMQVCPDCHATAGLRLCAIEPHAVIWCSCQRAWTYPTLTYEWVMAFIAAFPGTPQSSPWPHDEPIPSSVLQLNPGLDRLILTIDEIVAAGPVASHRRLTFWEQCVVAATDPDPGLLRRERPGQGYVGYRHWSARWRILRGIRLRR